MGFMKFIHKKPKEHDIHSKQDLDIPPLPPPMDGPDKDLGLTSIGEEMVPATKEELPEFPNPIEQPKMPEKELNFPEIHSPEPQGLTGAPVEGIQVPQQIIPETSVPVPEPTISTPQPEIQMHKRATDQPIFIEVGQYKNVLGDLGQIKSDLNKAHDALVSLEQDKVEEDKEFNKWHSCLTDMHSKLSMIDKILSKGGI